MDNVLRQPRGIPFGLLSLAAAFGGFVCWFLPFYPALFLFGIVGLQAISLLLAIVAGFRNSRWWFLAVAIPLFFIVFMVPQYEKNRKSR
jgi:hypothetical protein